MRKISIIFLLSLVVFIPFAANASFGSSLYYGLQSNSQVKELQDFLIDQGYLTGNSTGNFFSLTLSAVKKFQAANGLPSTGYFGVLSRQKANDILATNLQSSNQQATTEIGTTPPAPTPPATTSDVIATLQAQITLLQKQLNAMNAQTQATQQTNQQLQQQTQTIQQVQQNTQQIVQNTTTTTTPTPTQAPSNSLTIAPATISTTATSAHLEWDTNQPTNSKVFVTDSSGHTTITQSNSGFSTHHIADVSSLPTGSSFSYVIEAIAGNQDQKASGSFSTTPTLSASCSVSPNTVKSNQLATFTPTASGGTGTYKYQWDSTYSIPPADNKNINIDPITGIFARTFTGWDETHLQQNYQTGQTKDQYGNTTNIWAQGIKPTVQVTSGDQQITAQCPLLTFLCEGSPISIAKDASTPIESIVSKSVNRQPNIFAAFKVLANGNGNTGGGITKIVITRDGGTDDMFSKVYLIWNGQYNLGGASVGSVGPGYSVSSFANGKAEFNLSNFFSFAPISNTLLTVYADLNPDKAVDGTSIRLGIASPSDVTGMDSCDTPASINVSLLYPDGIWGNHMTIGE